MLYIPPTSKDIYVSSKVALNIHSPDDTGDWHSSGYLDNDRDALDAAYYTVSATGNTFSITSHIVS